MNKLHLLFIVPLLLLAGCANQETDPFKLNLREHKNLTVHIHPYVEIEILGENFELPADIGISDFGMRVIHTHDTSGKLHIESPFPHQFYLGDLFTVWGELFNKSCIMEFCVSQEFELKVFVNGLETKLYDKVPFYDGDKIKIVYSSKSTK